MNKTSMTIAVCLLVTLVGVAALSLWKYSGKKITNSPAKETPSDNIKMYEVK